MIRPSLAERFWAKVAITDPDACWLWQAWKQRFGYGRIYVHEQGRDMGAHVVSWFIHTGAWPDKGLCVLHACDTPSCVNFAHLWLGTLKDNSQDMVRKGRNMQAIHPERMARGERNGRHTHPEKIRRGDIHPFRLHPELHARGERNSQTKLSQAQRQELRELYATGQWTKAQLARRYGVTWGAIRYRLSVDGEASQRQGSVPPFRVPRRR